MREVPLAVSDSTRDLVRQVVREHGPLTRRQIAERTGLSRPSVAGAISDLLDTGIVEEVDAQAGGRGRPSRPIRVSRRRAAVVGIELGRGHVAVAIADAAEHIVASASREVDPGTSLRQRATIALTIADDLALMEGIDMSALRQSTVGTPGPRFRDGTQTSTDFSLARLERERATIAETVQRHYGTPVDVGNNTRFTALAEARRRQDSGASDLVYLRVDEGIGGGLVIDGNLASGSWGAAGEMGHVSIDPSGARCPCGGRGCLELVAALPALLKATGATSATDLMTRTQQQATQEVIARAAVATAGMLAGVLATINPRTIVIGGHVSEIPGFVETVEATLQDIAPTWTTLELAVERATVDHVLGAIGAAASASSLELPPSANRSRSN